jgi:hypothetical protein
MGSCMTSHHITEEQTNSSFKGLYSQIIPCLPQPATNLGLSLYLFFLDLLRVFIILETLHRITTSGRQNRPHATSQNYRPKDGEIKEAKERGAIRTTQATRAGQAKLQLKSVQWRHDNNK